ncbi:MAG: ABC transporter permease [Candidatus Acidiferrales bacterium]
MFGRLLWNLLKASRARLAVALLALISGAAVTSALINLELDMERKLSQEFRTLGANLVVSTRGAAAEADATGNSGAPALMEEAALQRIEAARTPAVAAIAPYLYLVAQSGNQQSVVVAGTWLDEIQKIEPWWKLQGQWVASRSDAERCIVGRSAARQLGAAPGSSIELHYLDRVANLTVSGIADAGGTEDNQIFVNLPVAQQLAGQPERVGLVQLSVAGSPKGIQAFADHLGALIPSLQVRPIRQIAEAEGSLLNRIRFLIFAMVILILVLTALCVLATMTALAMERRKDVGMMKALGGSINRIVALFLSEVSVLGATGGLAGYLIGIGLSRWIGERVFGAAITPRLEVLPITVALMIGIALAGALPLRLLGRVRPAIILRGE